MKSDWIIGPEAPVLVTGAAGFIGSRVVENLRERGFRDIRCLVRTSGGTDRPKATRDGADGGGGPRVIQGNLLSREDCRSAAQGVRVVYHLAAGRGEKLVPDAFMNSVVTTRNLLEACGQQGTVLRFVNVSSFSVYTNTGKPRGRLLDESCPVEDHPELRGDAYSFAKVKQDEIVMEYGRKYNIPHVMVRPGVVYGPGKEAITGRVGLGTFGLFLHLGGSNPIPFSYVDNCAEAIVLAGLHPGVDGEVFNVLDDEPLSSRRFLREYKRQVKSFPSIYLPHGLSFLLCLLWEKYSTWSSGQLPPAYNRRVWHAYWKKTRYSNRKLKERLGWTQKVSTPDAFARFFSHCQALQRARKPLPEPSAERRLQTSG